MKKIWTPDYCIEVRLLDDNKKLFQDSFLKYLYRHMFRQKETERPWGKISTCYEICKRVGEGDVLAWKFWMKLNKFQKDRFCQAAEMWEDRMYKKGTPVKTAVFYGKILIG